MVPSGCVNHRTNTRLSGMCAGNKSACLRRYRPGRSSKAPPESHHRGLTGSLDAIRSLRTSSQVVGAERLADLALDLEQSLRQEATRTSPDAALPLLAMTHLRPIRQGARQTAYLLQHYLHA